MTYTVYCKLKKDSPVAVLGGEIVDEVCIQNIKADSEKMARFTVEMYFPQFEVCRVEGEG
jgi:hypothetical protein